MYADYSRDQLNAFLSELTEQPQTGATEKVAESFSDDMIMAHMELARARKAAAKGEAFVPRADLLRDTPRFHPADLH